MPTLVLMVCSSLLLAVGLAMLVTAPDEERELSPAELSASRPVPRACWARAREGAGEWMARLRRVGRRPRTPPRREALLDTAEISAARTLLCGRICDL
jgi:hypothetical protein